MPFHEAAKKVAHILDTKISLKVKENEDLKDFVNPHRLDDWKLLRNF